MTTIQLNYYEPTKDQVKVDPLWWQERGLSYTRTGYGGKIPTQYKIKHENRWKRLYCMIYSNSGTCYILSKGKRLIVRDLP